MATEGRFDLLNNEEREFIYFALGLRKNFIETGDYGLAAEDALNQNIKVRPMDENQMVTAIKHRRLMREILNAKTSSGNVKRSRVDS